MIEDKYASLSRVEWEGFTSKLEVNTIKESELIPKGSETIEIWRDYNYKIKSRILGGYEDSLYELRGDDIHIDGTIVPGFEIAGSDYNGLISYNLSHCFIERIQSNVTLLGANPKKNFNADLLTYRIEKRTKHYLEADSLVEWYLNGPGAGFIFPRSTSRELKEDYIRKRFDGEEKLFPGTHKETHTRDFAFIELANRSFIIQSVPKHCGPSWSNCIGIEYRNEWGGIPDEEERKAISEVVSFVLGKHLLNVGYTKFADLGYPVEEVAVNPWGNNVVELCQKAALFPIDTVNFDAWGYIEIVLPKMISKYLLIRDELNLSQALWNYWISLDLALGVNLPILSAGVETIAKSWFKSSKSKTKGVYISKNEFEELLTDDFSSIEAKLKENQYQQRMLNKIKSAYNMGANERLNFFFSELGLRIGDVEREAMRGRNSMAHGDIMDDQEKFINLTNSFQTLFHRIFLKIIGYDGEYYDRSAKGWPKRPIDEPMEGSVLKT